MKGRMEPINTAKATTRRMAFHKANAQSLHSVHMVSTDPFRQIYQQSNVTREEIEAPEDVEASESLLESEKDVVFNTSALFNDDTNSNTE